MPLIKSNEVNSENLLQILTSAAFEAEAQEDGSIYLKRGVIDFGCWLKFNDDMKAVRLYTFAQCKEGAILNGLNNACAKLNEVYALVKFTTTAYEDGSLYLNGEYDLYYNFGIISEQLIHSIRMFSEIFLIGIRESDPDDEFFN